MKHQFIKNRKFKSWYHIISLFIFLEIFILLHNGLGNTIKIPDQFPKIQEGIEAAIPGDTVLVAPGTYAENINFIGKNIVLASHYIFAQDTSLIRQTVIFGIFPNHPDTASAVLFISGEDGNAVLEGFTVSGGKGTRWVDPKYPDTYWRGGGGILTHQSSPTIRHNRIIDNYVTNKTDVGGAQGGGILCFDGDPLIQYNWIEGNAAEYGGGVVLDYSGGRVMHNIIVRNEGGKRYGGGGIWTIGSGPAPMIFENNTVVENESETRGGAFFIWNGTAIIKNNIIRGNTQSSGNSIATEGNSETIVTFCNVEGGFLGAGNIDADPEFADVNFNLSPASPCIDAGDPGSPLDTDGTRADIGAVFFYHLDAPYITVNNSEIDDSQGNNNGKADAGETIRLVVSLKNTSLDGSGILAELTNEDPDIQISQKSASWGALASGEEGANSNQPFEFAVSAEAIPHYTKFILNISADGGYMNTDSIKILVGSPEILLVDDDNGAAYESYYTEPLKAILKFPDVWDVSKNGTPTSMKLREYKSVVWFTGDDQDSTLTTNEQRAISEYLEAGGNLLLSGQNIGHDLVTSGSESDSLFFCNYLHARLSATGITDKVINFVIGESLTNGQFYQLGGAGNQTTPCGIDTIGGSKIIFTWLPSYAGAGLKFEHPEFKYRLVYLSFGLEGVNEGTPGMLNKFLEKTLNWFEELIPTNITSSIKGEIADFSLSPNYPNPFNGATTIRYQIPKPEFVELAIFNILGQKVRTLFSENQKAATYQIIWDGKDDFGTGVSSGIYFYQLKAGKERRIRRLMFLQ